MKTYKYALNLLDWEITKLQLQEKESEKYSENLALSEEDRKTYVGESRILQQVIRDLKYIVERVDIFRNIK